MDILQVVKSYGIEIKRKGGLYVCYCPFHNDTTTPNLVLYPRDDSFYCYACNEHGGILWFMARMENKPLHVIKKKYADFDLRNKLEQLVRRGSTEYKLDVLKITSAITRQFLTKHKSLFRNVMGLLLQFDKYLLTKERINHDEYKRIMKKFNESVHKLKDKEVTLHGDQGQ